MNIRSLLGGLFIGILLIGCTSNKDLQIVNQNDKYGLHNVKTNKDQIPVIYDDLVLIKNYNS
ncbi:hypothetical protein, partial [Arcobacter sp. CECT 8985]|uniref:hypothetical protein n=1 Tax=Arcobacter sp. CECT 8985 TaxID=1935424 RepID=UPI0010261FD4